jgi:hypothetical protein
MAMRPASRTSATAKRHRPFSFAGTDGKPAGYSLAVQGMTVASNEDMVKVKILRDEKSRSSA